MTGSRYIGGLVTFTMLSYATLLLPRGPADRLHEENGGIESLGFLCLLAASIVFFVAWWRSSLPENRNGDWRMKRLSYLVLALLFVFGAAEEVSWGQHLIHFETPAGISAV